MSECPGYSLEAMVWDSFSTSVKCRDTLHRPAIDSKLRERLVAFYEPYRQEIERRVSRYDGYTCWRDYRMICVWDEIEDPPESTFQGETGELEFEPIDTNE